MVIDTSGFIASVPGMFIAGLKITVQVTIIFALAYLLQKIIQKLIQVITSRKKTPSIITGLIKPVLIWPVYIAATMIALNVLGVQLDNLWAVLTAAATLTAIGFVAVWSVLSNLLCTLMLILSRPFKIGDELEIIDPAMTAGINGQVRNINLLFTTLIKKEDETKDVWRFHIPNNLFFQKIIKCRKSLHSYSLEEQLFFKDSLLKTAGKK